MEYIEFYRIMAEGQEQPIESRHQASYDLRFKQLYDQLKDQDLDFLVKEVRNLSLAFRAGADLGTDLTARIILETSGVGLAIARTKREPTPTVEEPGRYYATKHP